MDISKVMRTVSKRYPEIIDHLDNKARWIVASNVTVEENEKGVDDYRRRILSLIRGLYNQDIGGEFIDGMAALIARQLTLAYRYGAADAGLYSGEFTETMQAQLDAFIIGEFNYVDKLYRDIIDARLMDAGYEQFSSRAELWAQRFKQVENAARAAVTAEFGGKMVWNLGATEQHCETCYPLKGKVAFAKEWNDSGLAPQSAALICGGWRCDCELVPTDRRRSPKAFDYIMSVPRK